MLYEVITMGFRSAHLARRHHREYAGIVHRTNDALCQLRDVLVGRRCLVDHRPHGANAFEPAFAVPLRYGPYFSDSYNFV